MPDCERLELLNINCDTTEADQNKGQVNKQSKEDKSKTKNNFKINLKLDSKNNKEMDNFLKRLEKETDRVASAKITKELHKCFFQALGNS